MKVLHIIYNDKFLSGYINYMGLNFSEYDNTFIIRPGKYDVDLMDENKDCKIIHLKKDNELLKKDILEMAKKSDKIIVTGVFDIAKYIFFWKNTYLRKTYLQFWGADFYGYRNVKKLSKMQLSKSMQHSIIKRCKGIINLVENDYDELSKIFPNKVKHYVGVMPADPRREQKFIKYLNFDNENTEKTIIVGNSATKENCHLEAFEMLRHLKDEDLKIICPLSYGDEKYKDEVIKKGKEIFKNKFEPITEFMNYDDYLELLSKCSVGIFNNNRQQAMGNINALLKIGKKIYLRSNTSMWKEYEKNNLMVFDIKDLSKTSYEDLFRFDVKYKKQNYDNIEKKESKWDEQWREIFENIK